MSVVSAAGIATELLMDAIWCAGRDELSYVPLKLGSGGIAIQGTRCRFQQAEGNLDGIYQRFAETGGVTLLLDRGGQACRRGHPLAIYCLELSRRGH